MLFGLDPDLALDPGLVIASLFPLPKCFSLAVILFSTVLRIRRSFYSREEYFRLFHLCLVSVEQIQIKAKSIIAYLHSKLIIFEDRFMENLNGKGSI